MCCYSIERVEFFKLATKIVGNLYTPELMRTTIKNEAIVLVAPQAGVKEQTVSNYAIELAKRGFICLTFDHATFGDSDGLPRFYENPYDKSEDISAAVTFLSTLSIVDSDLIYGVGICSGGGYLSYTAITDRRLKKVATVSAYFDHRGFYRRIMDSDSINSLLNNANESRVRFNVKNEIQYLPHAPLTRDPDMPELFKQFYDYYMTERGARGKYESKFLPWSYEKLLTFSVLDNASFLSPTPLLMIVGDLADSAYESENMYAAAGKPKYIIKIPGANHIDLYDDPIYIELAVDEITLFLSRE